MRRIFDSLSRWNEGSNLAGYVLTVSVGVAEWEDGKTLAEALDAADQDMYASKSGKA